MSKQLSQQGKVYYNADGSVNQLQDFANRVPATADAIASFYDRYKIVSGYLYNDMTGDINATTSKLQFFVGGCNEVTLQPIGTPGTIAVTASLDGATWVNAITTVGADGFVRVTTKYKWLRVSTSGSSTGWGIYIMVS